MLAAPHSNKRKVIKALSVLAICFSVMIILFLGWMIGGHSRALNRVNTAFELDGSARDTDAIRSQLLVKFPKGSPRKLILEFLESRREHFKSNEIYQFPHTESAQDLAVSFDQESTINLVDVGYSVIFNFDQVTEELTDIKAVQYLTGL